MPRRFLLPCFTAWMLSATVAYYTVAQFRTVIWAILGLSGTVAVLVGVRLHRPSRRLPWVLLACVLGSFTAGDTAYNFLTEVLHEADPVPSPADLFYLAVYPMLAAALLVFIRARSGGGNRAALLDALVPTAGLGLLSWVFLIAPYVRDEDLSVAEKLTSVGYPLGDVLALAMLLRLLTAPGRRPLALIALSAGVAGLLTTDVAYGLRQLAGTWAAGGPVDAGWATFYAATGLCALHPSMAGLTVDRAVGHPPAVHADGRRITVLSVAALIAPVLLLVQDLQGEVSDAPVIAVVCAMVFLLVMARVADLLSTQRDAGARERALREAGALLVAAADRQDALDAVRQAVDDLLPHGEPHRLHLVCVPATTVSAGNGSGTGPRAVLLEVAGLPADIADELTGFELALHTTITGAGDGDGGGAPVHGQAYLAAAPDRLHALRPSFDTLMAQAALAAERIALTDEVNRRNSEDYFRTLVHSASDVILIVDDSDEIRYASPSAAGVFGSSELVGTALCGLIGAQDHAELRGLLSRTRDGQDHRDSLGLIAVRADGKPLQVECGCRDLRTDPRVAGLVLTIRDITDRRRLEHDLTHQAYHDGLTGIANRLQFHDRLTHAVVRARRDGSTVGVLFIDLDDFKEVNDALGHTVGDQLLIAVAQRITRTVGPANTVARTGGDEFAVLVEAMDDPAEAERIAARIVAELAGPVEVDDGNGGSHVIGGTVSIGVATGGATSGTAELQRQADLAMYVAKSEGKNTWQLYRPDLHTSAVERLELRAALNDAADNDQLVVLYQPIVELSTQEMVGMEALVRWQHPTRGLLGPHQFIELAEENGAIVAIGARVLREALRTFVEWRATAPDSPLSYLSVNVSPRQFRTPGFVDQVRSALADTGAEPHRLLLEITESLMLRDAEKVWADLRELRAMGIRIAIDDFGTGYSSLSYLRQMPVDVLKIDKSFIDDIVDSVEQRALVEAIISLAGTLRLAVVAEGIEHGAHRRTLLEMGCPYGQGYLFSKPVPPAELARWSTPGALVS
jgi:diguanylate cyclase (GGDEF)-like protein/PAS domain S-box-containing protein